MSKLKHIEVEGCIVNIRTGLNDVKGRKVTSIEILPDDHYNGKLKWKLKGYINKKGALCYTIAPTVKKTVLKSRFIPLKLVKPIE